MPELTSTQNPRVKYIVKLREDRRQRRRDGVILVEGHDELELALASGMQPKEVFFCEALSATNEVVGLAIQPVAVNRLVFEKMSRREGPDGWLAVFPVPQRTFSSLRLSPAPFLVLAESVEKPGNLGAILRTADSAGVDGLLVCDPLVDPYNPNVIRSSRGTLFTVPVVETNSVEALEWLRDKGILILAATPQGDLIYSEMDLRQPICIAVGTEDEGLTKFWLENADMNVRIPMVGKVNSLNVSTSTAIIVYEAVRQRRL
jgi:TrmH family RNA methyltransferase